MATLNQERLNSQKRSRMKFFILLTIVEILVSIYLASVIHIFLTDVTSGNMNAFRNHIDISYLDAVKNIYYSKQIRQFFIFLQILYVALILYVTANIHQTISKVDTFWVTPEIELPVPAGNGQHGSERFLSETEKKQLYEIFIYDRKNPHPKIDDAGVVVQMIKENGKEYIFYVSSVHTLFIGSTGSGKTRRELFELLWLQICAGHSAVISDVKGEIYYYTHLYAEASGYQTIPFDLRNPKKSVHYNFLQPILDAFKEGDSERVIDYTWDLVSVFVGEQKGEPIWYNGECATIAAAILIVALEAPEEYRNLTNVYYFLANMCQADLFGNMPLNTYLEMLPDDHPAKGVFAMATIAADKTRSSFFTSALGTLRLFTLPSVAEMTSKSDFRLEDIASQKTILYMMIPDEKQTLYPLVSILIQQLYQVQVKQANSNGGQLQIATHYNLDEVANFPRIPVLINMATVGRSRLVWLALFFQAYEQGEKVYEKDFKTIKNNCQLKVYLKSDSTDTLEEISKSLGKYTVEVTSASSSVSDDRKSSMNYSSSSSLTGRSLLEPAEIKRIKQPYCLCMQSGEFSAINILPDLTEYRLNELYGLGDQKHNQKIIMEREAARAEREIPPLQLWGIWKEYQVEDAPMGADERVSFL